mgnify:FL=1
MSKRRLFYALWPDDRQRDNLRNHITSVAKIVEGDHVFRGNWHVKTAFIGDCDESLLPFLLNRKEEIAVEPFRLRFDRLEYWPRPRVACLVAATVPPELERLVTALNRVLEDYNIPVEDRTYRPHITVVRRARAFETQRLAQPALVEWSGVELVESVSQPGGTIYRPVKQ